MNIYDVADKAGVSIATVSRVINGNPGVSSKTREKVERVMSEMGYSPNLFARGLMVDSIRTIGLVTTDVRDFYYARAIQTIESEMQGKGYNVILCSTGEDINEKKKYIKLLLDRRVDGIVLIGSIFKERNDNTHIFEAAQKVPVVLINGDIHGDNIYSVLCDDCNAVNNATSYLINKGYRELAYIYDADTFSGAEKIKGFKLALSEHGIAVNESLIIKAAKGIQGGYEAVRNLLNNGIRYAGIITSEDILAAGVLKKLREEGISVPGDMAVIGYGNSVVAESTYPELTSIDNKVEATSSTAARILMDALENKNTSHHTVIAAELVKRNSTP